MSIKYKIIIFLAVLLVLSLGITVLYLSNSQFKPELRKEIIKRISQNLENNNNIVANHLINNAGVEKLYTVLIKTFVNNSELMYIRILDKINDKRYTYKKNLVILNIDNKELQIPRIETKMEKKWTKRIKNKTLTNEFNIPKKLYIFNNYKEEFSKDIRDFKTINSNFNEYIKFSKNVIASNQKINHIKIDRKIKKRLNRKLLNYVNRKLQKHFRQLKKLDRIVNNKSEIFEKKISIMYGDIASKSKNKSVFKINRINNKLIKNFINISRILEKNKNKLKTVRKVTDISKLRNMIFGIKKNINEINRDLATINKRIDDFIEIKLTFSKKTSKGKGLYDEIDLIKLYRKITWANNAIGYYEIGISDDAILNKIKPIIIKGIMSSTTILFISIIAGLLLALYIVYPIHILDKGADEILKDLKYRIKLKRKDEFGKFAHTFNHLADQLTEELSKYKKLYKEATEDQLTKLMVRRYFMGTLKSELKNAQKENRATALYMTDIDHFKKFNDTYGHQTGDIVLAKVGEILINKTRQNRVRNDVSGRYGGEEFVVLLPDTNKEEALRGAERIRKEIEKLILKTTKGRQLKVTISIGVASSGNSNISPKELIERADKALYHSKETGRNKVSYG